MSLLHPAANSTATQDTGRTFVAETPRLLLRQLERSDLPFMVELFGSLEVMRFSLSGPLAAAQAAEILEQFLKAYTTQPLAQWGVTEKSSGQLIGLCGFLIRDGAAANEWELAYRFLPTHWGRKLATEAATACRDLAFQIPDIAQITAFVEKSHTASIRVVEKVGLRLQSVTQLQGISVLKYQMPRPANS